MVNIPDDAPGDAALAASEGGSPHNPSFPRISSFTGSDGNRRRRKPFKSSSNHSLKATHPQMLSHRANDPSGLHLSSGPESHDGSQQSYSTHAASHGAPVHGFHVPPAGGVNPAVYDYSSDSPRWGMKVDGMYDDGASSFADSQQTSVTTSSNTGVDREQKRLIDYEHEKHTRT